MFRYRRVFAGYKAVVNITFTFYQYGVGRDHFVVANNDMVV